MINKFTDSIECALSRIGNGATLFVSGFGSPGCPYFLLEGLSNSTARDLTIIANNGGVGSHAGLGRLLDMGKVRKLICSYPRSKGSTVLQRLYLEKAIELEIVPQGTLSERIRAAAAGIGAFYTRTSVGTALAVGKEIRTIAGDDFVLEYPLHADVALLRAYEGDRWGNLIYRGAGRNYGPLMAAAAKHTIVEVEKFTKDRPLNPEHIVTPGIFVDQMVLVPE
jgi:3-oxoadipate CoA-transferase alpha subunit